MLTDKVWVLPEYPHIEYKYYLKKVSMFRVSLKVINFKVEPTFSQSVIFGAWKAVQTYLLTVFNHEKGILSIL